MHFLACPPQLSSRKESNENQSYLMYPKSKKYRAISSLVRRGVCLFRSELRVVCAQSFKMIKD